MDSKRLTPCDWMDGGMANERQVSCDPTLAACAGWVYKPRLPPALPVSQILHLLKYLNLSLFQNFATTERCLFVCISAQKRIYISVQKERQSTSCLFVCSKAHIYLYSKAQGQMPMSVCLLKRYKGIDDGFSAKKQCTKFHIFLSLQKSQLFYLWLCSK